MVLQDSKLDVTEGHVREVTDDEVAFLQENGWVKLEGLLTPDLVSNLRQAAHENFDGVRQSAGAGVWNGPHLAAKHHVEPFDSLVFGKQMGRNAQRLINRGRLTDREIPIRLRVDVVVNKDPRADASDEPEGTGATPFHQDSPEHGPDRIGEIGFWIALGEVTPEMGSMRFVTGSHREGPLGAGIVLGEDLPDALAQYPKLLDIYDLSPPIHYQPGDATVHLGFTLHGAPKNTTDIPRWSYIIQYCAADILFTPPSTTPRGQYDMAPRKEFAVVYP